MPRFLPPFPVGLVGLTAFERGLVSRYTERQALAIFGPSEVKRVWRCAWTVQGVGGRQVLSDGDVVYIRRLRDGGFFRKHGRRAAVAKELGVSVLTVINIGNRVNRRNVPEEVF
jgi:hypothetical protein